VFPSSRQSSTGVVTAGVSQGAIEIANARDLEAIAELQAVNSKEIYTPIAPEKLVKKIVGLAPIRASWQSYFGAQQSAEASSGNAFVYRVANGEIAGIIQVMPKGDRPLPEGRAEDVAWEIKTLQVAKQYRRHGIGKALLLHAFKELKAEDKLPVLLWSNQANPRACFFYSGLGAHIRHTEEMTFTAKAHPDALTEDCIAKRVVFAWTEDVVDQLLTGDWQEPECLYSLPDEMIDAKEIQQLSDALNGFLSADAHYTCQEDKVKGEYRIISTDQSASSTASSASVVSELFPIPAPTLIATFRRNEVSTRYGAAMLQYLAQNAPGLREQFESIFNPAEFYTPDHLISYPAPSGALTKSAA
jgi:ribosomal protein S18 acetylase RimI-like enzyme